MFWNWKWSVGILYIFCNTRSLWRSHALSYVVGRNQEWITVYKPEYPLAKACLLDSSPVLLFITQVEINISLMLIQYNAHIRYHGYYGYQMLCPMHFPKSRPNAIPFVIRIDQLHLSKVLFFTILIRSSLQCFSLYCSQISYKDTNSWVHSTTALISTSLSASQLTSF